MFIFEYEYAIYVGITKTFAQIECLKLSKNVRWGWLYTYRVRGLISTLRKEKNHWGSMSKNGLEANLL